VFALAALGASLLHLGRPVHAWKALRNLRRSWLSREVALLGAYGMLAAAAVPAPVLVPAAVATGLAGTFASARLYVVPGRPAWHTPLTIVRFFATALAVGPLLTGRPGWAIAGIAIQAAATLANLLRLRRDPRIERWGTVRLTLDRFRGLAVAVVLGWLAGAVLAVAGLPLAALVPVVGAELVGRYLFYVTVVPLDMPGSFARSSKQGR
jgi:DMSO reductase anchor subunit